MIYIGYKSFPILRCYKFYLIYFLILSFILVVFGFWCIVSEVVSRYLLVWIFLMYDFKIYNISYFLTHFKYDNNDCLLNEHLYLKLFCWILKSSFLYFVVINESALLVSFAYECSKTIIGILSELLC